VPDELHGLAKGFDRRLAHEAMVSLDFKRAGDEPLRGTLAVRRQYQEDWHDHDHVVVTPNRVFESGRAAVIEIHVESGPPSNVTYDGVVVHEWNEADQLVRYRLYVDEVVPTRSDAR